MGGICNGSDSGRGIRRVRRCGACEGKDVRKVR